MKKKARICVICGKPIPVSEGLGFSAEPIKSGSCCSKCYRTQVRDAVQLYNAVHKAGVIGTPVLGGNDECKSI